MVYEERYGECVTCPQCEARGAHFDDIPITPGTYEEVGWQRATCPRCAEEWHYKRVPDGGAISSLWIADRTGEPVRRYVIFPDGDGRRVLWRMFVEDPLHTFLARLGFYDRYLQRVRPTSLTVSKKASV